MMVVRLASILLCFYCLIGWHQAEAQWQVGSFTPYLTQPGVSAAYFHTLKHWNNDSTAVKSNLHQLGFLAEVGYAHQAGVSRNTFVLPALRYKWNRAQKRFFLAAELGIGYQLAWQQTDIQLNLSTGETRYSHAASHNVLPMLSLGMGIDPRKRLGVFAKTSLGYAIGITTQAHLFVSSSAGILFKFKTN